MRFIKINFPGYNIRSGGRLIYTTQFSVNASEDKQQRIKITKITEQKLT